MLNGVSSPGWRAVVKVSVDRYAHPGQLLDASKLRVHEEKTERSTDEKRGTSIWC